MFTYRRTENDDEITHEIDVPEGDHINVEIVSSNQVELRVGTFDGYRCVSASVRMHANADTIRALRHAVKLTENLLIEAGENAVVTGLMKEMGVSQ